MKSGEIVYIFLIGAPIIRTGSSLVPRSQCPDLTLESVSEIVRCFITIIFVNMSLSFIWLSNVI